MMAPRKREANVEDVMSFQMCEAEQGNILRGRNAEVHPLVGCTASTVAEEAG